ncbi:MAG: hypothetical protein JXR95_08110 [Deltaproteobacteria bacterium]|nr:hypothetical protein [Deltaproteobacteria bacterium]
MTQQDHTYLINKIREHISFFEEYPWGDSQALDDLKVSSGNKILSSVVLSEDTVLELGPPGKLSVSRGLWTRDSEIVSNKLYLHGDHFLHETAEKQSFLYMVVIQMNDSDRAVEGGVFRIMNMINKIPGIMTKIFPGKLWIRVHRKVGKNFSLFNFAQVVRNEYQTIYPEIKNIDIFIAAGNDELISSFQSIASAAGVISGENTRLKWESEGIIACTDLDCSVCDEKTACDIIRKVVTFRKRNQ